MWKRIPKEVSTCPTEGIYSDWKPNLSVEGYHQCVYCFVSETYFGGIRNFHVEHYRPKKKFEELTNDYKNLFYACSICNSFKSEDWPNEPNAEYDIAFYPNPSVIDYSEIFEIDANSFDITGNNFTSRYLVNRLFLNRRQLIVYRKSNFVEEKYRTEIERAGQIKELLFRKIEQQKNPTQCVGYLRKFEEILNRLQSVYRKKKQPFLILVKT
ncbi:HNH endonuclease [Chryseobacterium sp. MEBOG07]|uniref:HNH endonuclease n=1 Tax=Chryseobacterium sp. MEBOG07 TaxID=2879939 RepID=UPI001F01918D|nr:HNH endonuclease [Chryseobacterium sp. MEBOG07]UKB79560.1 HNH endonuclease [Chryseobacterium sp. MEBOG07]